ncbi:hypothetical protein KC640_01825 [Candidatus Dojkabacteria bacterium]|uniref:Uncharacterized protein n=1 Tax=Candidatus Dojkabacteria bacterium TaxID=2099670 RepID=A0A955KYU0_9BACT|nr:hypothetical protein [Candidatus Dojkabacteria bacterium]
MTTPSSEEILAKTRELLKNEGYDLEDNSTGDKLDKLIIPALAASRNVQGALYSYEPAYGSSIVRKLKNFVLGKLRNITVAVVEKAIMRQQKVNELTYQAILELQKENAQLRKQLESNHSRD